MPDIKLRMTAGFIWYPNSVNLLGRGATGEVYIGREKKTGDRVAVKTFLGKDPRPLDVQKREWEVQRTLNHKNVVRLLAVEEEVANVDHMPVLIMELCTGGSLYDVLDDPENHFGLSEDEFLLVLGHVAHGMQHLREKGIVHRDIKPGNIMRYFGDDGRSVYKLTDFGAARELQDEEQFMSLYGTEEYLHPQMYSRAVVRRYDAERMFGVAVDLWSMGVTFFHTLTGQLPFRPYEGIRQNRSKMYDIIVHKQSGIISGVQKEKDGPIKWSKDLPPTCRISVGLKRYIIPILAGIIESDKSKVWSFPQFFKAVDEIAERNRIHLFITPRFHHQTIYLHKNDTFDDMTRILKRQLPEADRGYDLLLVHKNTVLTDASAQPRTIAKDPVYVYYLGDFHRSIKIDAIANALTFCTDVLVNYRPLSERRGSLSERSLSDDFHESKDYCSLTYVIQRLVSELTLTLEVVEHAVQSLIAACRFMVGKMSSLCCHLTTLHNELQLRVTSASEQITILRSVLNEEDQKLLELVHAEHALKKTDKQRHELYDDLQSQLLLVKEYTAMVEENQLIKTAAEAVESEVTDDVKLSGKRSEKIAADVREIYEQFFRDKRLGRLDNTDEQSHKFDKQKLRYRAEDATKLHALTHRLTCNVFKNVTVVLRTMNVGKMQSGIDALEKLLEDSQALSRNISSTEETVRKDLKEALTNVSHLSLSESGTNKQRKASNADTVQRAKFAPSGDKTEEIRKLIKEQQRIISEGAQNLSNISTLNFMKDLDLDDENDDDYEVILKA